jgi:hypothetical protein
MFPSLSLQGVRYRLDPSVQLVGLMTRLRDRRHTLAGKQRALVIVPDRSPPRDAVLGTRHDKTVGSGGRCRLSPWARAQQNDSKGKQDNEPVDPPGLNLSHSDFAPPPLEGMRPIQASLNCVCRARIGLHPNGLGLLYC